MTEDDRRRWNARYEAADAPPNRPVGPPDVFAAFEDYFPTEGQALDIACGAGAGSVWLAGRGMDVWGIDLSGVAIARAADLAANLGVAARCRFELIDLDAGLPGGPPVDVILCHMFRGDNLERAMIERLAPGGLLAIAVLSEVGSEPGPFRANRGELVRAFAELDVIDQGEADGRAWILARSAGAT